MPNPNPEIIEVMSTHSLARLRAIIARLEYQRDQLAEHILDGTDEQLKEDLKLYGLPIFKSYFKSNDYKVPGR